jgi:hypothetical protein
VAVSPDGRSAYVVNDLDGTVSQYTIDPATGALSPKSPPTVPTDGFNPAGIAVSLVPTNHDQCKNGGWKKFGTKFKNQGQCVRFVRTGK